VRNRSTSRRVIESLSTEKRREKKLFRLAKILRNRRKANAKKNRKNVSKNSKALARQVCVELQMIKLVAQFFDTHLY